MTKSVAIVAILLLAGACAPRRDPRVDAAYDFQQTAFDLIHRDEQRLEQLNSLRLGMSDQEVLQVAGPPTRRDTLGAGYDVPREVWFYNGELKQLATLTFEGGRLVQLKTP